MERVLAVDPGSEKCGVAVVSREGVVAREVCPVERLVSRVRALLGATGAEVIVVGAGTNGRKLARAMRAQPDFPPLELVDEAFSTQDARKRYFQTNPPAGWRRLIPRSLQIPPRPVDDLVAVILGERYLNALQPEDPDAHNAHSA